MDQGMGTAGDTDRRQVNPQRSPTLEDARRIRSKGSSGARLLRAAGLVAAAAVLAGWATPRGPITSSEAIATMVAAFVLGGAAAWLARTRLSLVGAPVLFLAVFELARRGTAGATVGGVHREGLLGTMAFVLGRIVPGLMVVVPLTLGGLVGSWLVGRLGHAKGLRMGAVGATATVIGTLAVVALAVAIAQPARTAPILGRDGAPLPGSIAELATVRIGGQDQVMLIRGRSAANPVLLYLAGGPGGTDLGAVRQDTTLEQAFTVVAWDQRGAGKSYAAIDPTSELTVDRLVADTIRVAEYLRERFDEDKVYLVGQSWGSTLGVLAAQRRPDLFHAYVGIGQMVSQRGTDRLFWEDALAWARATGNADLERTLVDNGAPPYQDLYRYDPVVSTEHDWNAYPEFDPGTEMPAILFVPEYTFMDRLNAFRGFLDTTFVLYPQLQGIDFRADVPRLDVPVHVVLGNREARGRAALAQEWFEGLEAPMKAWHVIEGGGHRAHFDDPRRFAEIMKEVLAQVERTG